MTETTFLFGPLGYMQDLGRVRPGISRQVDRPRGELITGGGVRYTQKARHAPRTWPVEFSYKTPDAVRLLMAAAQGILKDCWLYDVAGARANMLPGHLTAGTGNPVLVAGIPLGALTPGQTVQVPLPAGRTYTISAWSALAAGATAFTYRLGSGANTNAAAPAGTGVRAVSATVTPATDQILTVTIGTSADISGLRVHEGPPDGFWYPGHGTPCRVDVIDPNATLQLVVQGQSRADYTISLQEVGIPGVI